MEKMIKNRKSLWMRRVDFGKIRDALQLVSEYNGQLRAKDLEDLGAERGFFRRENGEPFSRTTMYHYRKVMEHLQMVKLDQQRYFVDDIRQFSGLLKQKGKTRTLSSEDKEILANAIILNSECQAHFFHVFSLSQKMFTSVEQFRNEASFITSQTEEKKGGIILRNPKTEVSYTLDTNDKVQAIFWGVRLWSMDLGITDEIFTYREGRVIFPILKPGSLKGSEIVKAVLPESKPEETWQTISAPELTRKWSPYLRVSTRELHDAIKSIQVKFPQYVDFIPTSKSFIDIRTPFEKRDKVLFKGYIRDSQGRFISHIRLHRSIWEEYNGEKEAQ
jgi:hypothetical protein